MEPPSEPVVSGIFASDKPEDAYQEAIAEALSKALTIAYNMGVIVLYEEEIGLMDTSAGSMGIFNALMYMTADHMAIHAVQSCMSDEHIEKWKERAQEAFNKTLETQLEERRTEFAQRLADSPERKH